MTGRCTPHVYSVLSMFICSLLLLVHCNTSSIQCDMLSCSETASSGRHHPYTWESSAYIGQCRLCFWISGTRSAVYSIKAPSRTELSCSGGDESSKVRPHHSCAPSLASSPSENQLQARNDSLQVPTQLAANVLGGRLFSNLYHCWQATTAVCLYRVTVGTKNKDHTLGTRSFTLLWRLQVQSY